MVVGAEFGERVVAEGEAIPAEQAGFRHRSTASREDRDAMMLDVVGAPGAAARRFPGFPGCTSDVVGTATKERVVEGQCLVQVADSHCQVGEVAGRHDVSACRSSCRARSQVSPGRHHRSLQEAAPIHRAACGHRLLACHMLPGRNLMKRWARLEVRLVALSLAAWWPSERAARRRSRRLSGSTP